MNLRKLFTFEVNLNVVGARPILTFLIGSIMTQLEDLATIKAGQARVNAEIEKANEKFDLLIVISNTTKDALTELQASLPTGDGTGGTPVADVVQVKAAIKDILDAQDAAIASLKAQEVEGDAAVVAVAP